MSTELIEELEARYARAPSATEALMIRERIEGLREIQREADAT